MRFNYNRKALGNLGLWLGLVGVIVETLQTSIDTLDINIDGQLQTINELVSGNSTAINTLAESSATMGDDIEARFNYHVKALGDIGLWLGLVGVTVETLHTSISALEINLDDQFQSLQSIVDGNSNSITDLEMSSSSMGVTVEIIQTSIDALDTNLDGQLQSLNETVNINSIAITTLGDDIKTCFNYHRNVLGDLGLGLGLVGVTVQTLQTSLDALDTNIEGQLQTLNEGVNKTQYRY